MAIDKRILDPRWRLNHFYKIIDKQGNLVTFKENEMQQIINNSSSKLKRGLKYRQGGFTTNEVLKALDFVSFNRNKTSVIMAHKKDAIEKIFSIIRLAHKYMDPKLRPVLDKGGGSKYELRFPEIDSRIYCALEVRGGTINWLHISEAAFTEPARLQATKEAVPLDGIITEESTPNGMNNFYDDWMDKDSPYENMFFPWFLQSEYLIKNHSISTLTKEEKLFIKKAKATFNADISKDQIAFRRAKQKQLKHLFLQEYPEDDISCFLTSSNSPMDLVMLSELKKEAPKPTTDLGWLKVWHPKDNDDQYAIGADVAEGVASDYSVATVISKNKREQVAQIRSNKWKPKEFAHKIFELAKLYSKGLTNLPLLAVERNNHGHAVLLELENLDYDNLYHYKEDRPGWLTDRLTRPLILDILIESVENRTLTVNSIDTISEMITLIDNDAKIEAASGYHDDCVMALAIGIQMLKELPDLDLYSNLKHLVLTN